MIGGAETRIKTAVTGDSLNRRAFCRTGNGRPLRGAGRTGL